MPFQKQATKSAIVVSAPRRAPMVSKAKFEALKDAAKNKSKRTREVAARRAGTLVGVASAGAVGYLERTGKLPPKFTSVAALGVAGGVLAFVMPETGMGKGKLGGMMAEAGASLLGVAAYKLGAGQPIIGEDDTEYAGDDTEAGWEEEA